MYRFSFVLIFCLGMLLLPSCKNKQQPYIYASESSDSQDDENMVYACGFDGFVNIRENPSDKNKNVVGQFPNGPDGAKVLDEEGEWTKIDYDGTVGYVYSKYIQRKPTVAVDKNIDIEWLTGWWSKKNVSPYEDILVFDNGTFAVVDYSNNYPIPVSCGTYILKGSKICLSTQCAFMYDYIDEDVNIELAKSKRVDEEKKIIEIDVEKCAIKNYEKHKLMKSPDGLHFEYLISTFNSCKKMTAKALK